MVSIVFEVLVIICLLLIAGGIFYFDYFCYNELRYLKDVLLHHISKKDNPAPIVEPVKEESDDDSVFDTHVMTDEDEWELEKKREELERNRYRLNKDQIRKNKGRLIRNGR